MGRWAEKRQKQKEKITVKKEARYRLEQMFRAGFGQHRHEDKKVGLDRERIYSKNTYETYKAQFKKFADFCTEHHSEQKHLNDIVKYVDEYLTFLIEENRSAWSIATAKSAIAKVYGVSLTDFRQTPARNRENIKRSRKPASQDKNISKATEKKFAKFTTATGLRRAELERVTGDDLVFNQAGVAFLKISKGSKGGKVRYAIIQGKDEAETAEIIAFIKSRKGKRVFNTVPSHLDNHYYRSRYAQRLYEFACRPINDIPLKERYVMRKDRKGEILDKKAMLWVSQQMGHNRIDIIANNYLFDDIDSRL